MKPWTLGVPLLIMMHPITAFAEGQDVDISIIQPSFSTMGVPGITNVGEHQYGSFRYGVQSFWIRDPLIYLENNIDQGAVVSRRVLNQMGVEFDFSNRIGVHASVPVALQWASEVPSISRNGLGIGDLQAGIYGKITKWNDIQFGSRAGIFLPISTNDAWLGEQSPRLSVLGNASTSIRDLDIVLQTGPHFRTAINTNLDFVLDNEWIIDTGVKWNIWPERVALTGSYHSRSGLNNLFRGGAENTSEVATGIQWTEQDHIWQLGLSKGLNKGYGASEFQFFFGYTVHRNPKVPVEEAIPVIVEKPVVIEEPEILEPNWEPEELAKIEADQILIREDIQFTVGTAKIVESSLPTVEFIANLINNDVQIGHLVIEGHASAEGIHAYNYDLSNLRARAIFKALAEAGVHPDRMSHRGYGEALPKNLNTDEVALAENRRVEFHIVRQDPPDTALEVRKLQSAPWSIELLNSLIPTGTTSKPEEDSYEEELFESNPSAEDQQSPSPVEEIIKEPSQPESPDTGDTP